MWDIEVDKFMVERRQDAGGGATQLLGSRDNLMDTVPSRLAKFVVVGPGNAIAWTAPLGFVVPRFDVGF